MVLGPVNSPAAVHFTTLLALRNGIFLRLASVADTRYPHISLVLEGHGG